MVNNDNSNDETSSPDTSSCEQALQGNKPTQSIPSAG